jgi:patatin-related protein
MSNSKSENVKSETRPPDEQSPNCLPEIEAKGADITQEIRFAVVMYGGSSLAIYMNGVAQELFHLVRATAAHPQGKTSLYLPDPNAPSKHNKKLGGTEAVYRRLAQLLGTQYASFQELDKNKANTVHTRFVVDIISGTSAGGINGVFLAKALANDQDFGVLKKLWVDGGNIETLLNDAKSLKIKRDALLQSPNRKLDDKLKGPQSLLNSQRMYLLIYKALKDMRDAHKRTAADKSPYVDDLDLFVTRTDIYGRPIQVSLSDNTVITELQHRDVVHFQYADWLREAVQKGEVVSDAEGNDFLDGNDPFLAYAARCTSAFPFAFEPMCLADIQPLIGEELRGGEFNAKVMQWMRFFAEASENSDKTPPQQADLQSQATKRPYTDGGVLNNKPFSYAIDTLCKRWSDKSVQRKLVYIEPNPQTVSPTQSDLSKPDALAMIPKALIELPGYETIHSELQRVLDRNTVVDRVNMILQEAEKDFDILMKADATRSSQAAQAQAKGGMWGNGWLAGKPEPTGPRSYKSYGTIVQERGIAYGAYHHLKMEAVTDDITRYLACQLDVKKDSAAFSQLRELVTAWRQDQYDKTNMEPEFLLRFDLSFRMRRLLFLRSKINSAIDGEIKGSDIPLDMRDTERLLQLKKDLIEVFDTLRRCEYRLTSSLRNATSLLEIKPLRDYIRKVVECLHNNTPENKKWLDSPARQESREAANDELIKLIANIQAQIEAVTKGPSRNNMQAAAIGTPPNGQQTHFGLTDRINNLLKPNKNVLAETDKTGEKGFPTLQGYMQNFEVYDSILFPALYGTGVGETSHVDLIRISPLDATTLIDEHSSQRRKLAGTALGNFGALLKRSWRTNDIMWGRLDASERLLRDLAPQDMLSDDLCKLITGAQRAIVSEEMLPEDQHIIQKWLFDVMPTLRADDRAPKALESLVRANFDVPAKQKLPPLAPIFEYLLQADGLLDYMKAENGNGYEVDRTLPPRDALQTASRSAAVVGKILQNAADARGINNPVVSWIARIGQIFANIVEVALPNGLPYRIFRHLLMLLYLFEAFLIIGGVLFGSEWALKLGWNTLLVTFLAHVGLTWLHSFMQQGNGNKRFLRLPLMLLIIGVLILFGIGFYTTFFTLLPQAFRSAAFSLCRTAPGLCRAAPGLRRYLPLRAAQQSENLGK